MTKRLCLLLIILFSSIFLLNFTNQQVPEEKPNIVKKALWIPYSVTADYTCRYDMLSIKKVDAEHRSVFVKIEYSDKSRNNYIASRQEHNLSIQGYEKFDHTENEMIINCNNKTFDSMSTIDYDDEMRHLDRTYFFGSDYKSYPVNSNSQMVNLYNELCKSAVN